MKEFIMTQLDKVTELLQYFTGSVATTQTTKKYAATNIGVGLAAGDIVVVAGFSNSASNGTKTLVTVATSEITVSEAIGANEAGVTATFNQEFQGNWHDVRRWAKITGAINCSGNGYVYIDQSGDGITVDYTTTRTIAAATADSWSIEIVLSYARMRIRTDAADQSSMRAYLYGRIIT